MPDTDAELGRLRELLAADPAAITDATGGGDIKSASAALSRYAASNGLSLTAEDVERAFTVRAATGHAEPLDDADLDKVAGGGATAHCHFSVDCYCIFTN